MNQFNKLLFSLLLLLPLIGVSQESFTISGYLKDAASGEELLFANVLAEKTNQGVTTNEYGFYSLTLASGNYEVAYSYIGYETFRKTIQLDKNIRLDIELSSGAQLKEVVIKSSEENENVRSVEMSVATLNIKDAKLLPVLFGEQDILKTLQLLPGVSASSEGSAGFFVRGGDADQNLVLLDEAPVYNASHLLGFFSVFNSDALKDVKLYKGGIPAQYGGRLSSVLDIRMKNGNAKRWNASGGIGLISSRLTVEGPITKDNGSIMLSGRRTYADVLLKAFSSQFDDATLYFYDFNAKVNYNIGEKDRIFLSGYFGKDRFGFGPIGLEWGNTTGTLRWNHIYNDKLFANTSFVYSDFNYGFGIDNAGSAIELSAGIFDYNLKQDYNWYPNPNNSIQFGWNAIYHKFKPGKFTSDNPDSEENIEISIAGQEALETGVYLDNEQKINDRLSIYYGFRVSAFSNIGEYDEKEYNEADEIIKTTHYEKGEFYNNYFRFEPRASASFLLNDVSSVKASFNRMHQYLHLLSNSTSGTPTDLWLPTSALVKPEVADQIALGYFRNFKNNTYEFSFETYYKRLTDLVDYEDGAETFLNPNIEAELVFGKGRAYGAEFYLKKTKGDFKGWIAYTLSTSERQFDAINDGDWFSARQDRTHDIAVVGTYKLSPRWTLSGAWIYYTGDAVTFPIGKYEIDGELITLFSGRNGDRMPDYHRLDLGATFLMKDRPKWRSELNFSIYNTYNRKNAFSIDFRENGNTTEAVKTSLFGIIPSITWNFEFK